MKTQASLACAVTVLLFSSCQRKSAAVSSALVRDSAGIEMMDVYLPELDSFERWSLAPTPSLEVGVPEGEEPYLLEEVRAARKTPAGGVLVLNAGISPGIRFFDSCGQIVRTLGGAGAGPGEFKGKPRLIEYHGDSLATWDPVQSRITIFPRESGVERTITVSPSGMPRLSVQQAIEPDGFLAVRGTFLPARPNRRNGWEHTFAVRINQDGNFDGYFDELPILETQLDDQGHTRVVEFGGRGYSLPYPGGFVWVRTDIAEFMYFRADGTLRRILRFHGLRQSVTNAVWNRYVEAQRTEAAETMSAESLARFHRDLQARPRASLTPSVSRPIFASDSVVWFRPFSFPWEGEPPLVRIDFRNKRFSRVDVPSHSLIHEIGRDHVVLSRVDDLGVPIVELFSLRRGQEVDDL